MLNGRVVVVLAILVLDLAAAAGVVKACAIIYDYLRRDSRKLPIGDPDVDWEVRQISSNCPEVGYCAQAWC